MTFDGKSFGAEIVAAVKSHMDFALAPILARLDEVEKRQPLRAADGKDGKDGAPGKDGRDGNDGAPGRDGVGIRDLDVNLTDGGKTMVVTFGLGDVEHSFEVPLPPGPQGDPGKPGEVGTPGRDGLDVKDMFRAEGGRVVAVMSDGTTRDLGVVVGKDGVPGRDGKDGLPGLDGVGFDDLDLIEADDGVFLRFTRGEQVKSFRLPIVIDCGVYREGKTYHRGNGVTWAGSFWIAQEETQEKPDSGKGWRLSVKRGRDGKDGK